MEDVPKSRWGTTSAADAMVPVDRIDAVDPDESGLGVLEKMEEARAGLLAVVSGDEVVGVIRHKDVYSRTAPRSQQQKGET